MLEQMIQLSLRYKALVLAIFTCICFLGFKAYIAIPIDAFPDISPNQVLIYTESPGNSAEDIEKLITYPVESRMSGMEGVQKVISTSVFGLSWVAIYFEDGIDINFLRQLVSERLSTVDIPEGWGKPVLGPNVSGLGQVFWYNLKDETGKYSLQELREFQEYIVAPLLRSVSGVEEVTTWGGFEKQYNIQINTAKLQDYAITYDDVIDALQKSNIAAGGQYLEFNREQYLIRGSGLFENLEDISNTPIKSEGDEWLVIGDVATISSGASPRFGAVSVNGQESIMGMVLQRTNTNASKVVDGIKAIMPKIDSALPKGVQINTLYDRSEITKKAVATMTSSVISGVILVAIILFLFLFEIRSALIVLVSLPVSLLFAFLVMKNYGLSSNLMSLSGLAIAIGMIVDGTIVVVENSFRFLNEHPHESKTQTILRATKEVAAPITFAILIIIATFIPLISLDGMAGKLYTPLALTIVFVMLGSLLVALFLIPILSVYLLRANDNGESIVMVKIKKYYEPMLDWTLHHSKQMLIVISLIFCASAVLFGLQGREFMPKLNEESIMFRVNAIPGTALSESVETAQAIETFLLQGHPKEVDSVVSMIGRSEKGETSQANYMEVLLILKPQVKNIGALSEIISEELEEAFEYVQFSATQPIASRIEELLEGVKSELAIKIFGPEQSELKKIADQIEQQISSLDGLKGAEQETQLGQAQITITPNYDALKKYKISVSEIMNIINYGIGEKPVTEKIEGVKRFPVVLKIDGAKDGINALKEVIVRSQDGSVVTLDQVSNIVVSQGASFIQREDLSRYMVMAIEVEGRDVASFVDEANKIIDEKVSIPDGYYIDWSGDFRNMEEASQSLLLIIPVTLLIVMFLLFMAFNSFKKATLILMNIPFALIGAFIALVLSGTYLSVSSVVGIIAIFAIAVLNGIVLVTFIDQLREKFLDTELSILLKKAALLRLRPVLMTALTTLFGILPLLFSSGVGSEIHYPLAIAVIGGIISSTALTLLLLPGTYLLFYKKEHGI